MVWGLYGEERAFVKWDEMRPREFSLHPSSSRVVSLRGNMPGRQGRPSPNMSNEMHFKWNFVRDSVQTLNAQVLET